VNEGASTKTPPARAGIALLLISAAKAEAGAKMGLQVCFFSGNFFRKRRISELYGK